MPLDPTPTPLTDAITVLLCGVGGQGTILGADLLAKAAIAAGWQVKLSEVHGMAQRGGAVTTVVRFGPKVASMVTDPANADYIIAFETTEALRNLPYLKPGGHLIVSTETLQPLTVLAGNAKMPENPIQTLKTAGALLVPALEIAQSLSNPKCSNVVLLGVAAQSLTQYNLTPEIWQTQIQLRLPPHLVPLNQAALQKGLTWH